MFVYSWFESLVSLSLWLSLYQFSLNLFSFYLPKQFQAFRACVYVSNFCFFFSPSLSENAVVCWTLDMQNISVDCLHSAPHLPPPIPCISGIQIHSSKYMANTGQIAHDHLLFACLRLQLCVIHCEHIPASFSDQKGVFLSVFSSSRRIWRDTWALQASPTKCTESLWSGALSSPWWLWVRRRILWMYWFWSAF